MRRSAALILLTLTAVAFPLRAQRGSPASDLDQFMQQVLARRDDNWKKLQQYILDERERLDIRGPGEARIFGQQRDYSWFVRDGYFVRSPVRINGVAVSESDRQKAEDQFLQRAKSHEKDSAVPAVVPGQPTAADLQNALRQVHPPQFISSAYFLKFKFEPGHYAIVGREKLEGRDVLRIEYYPSAMFNDEPSTRTERRVRQSADHDADESYGAEMQRLMNKTSLVTLWIEPRDHQIVRYTFDNAGLDFLPAQWLVQVSGLRASMVMSEAFPGVWLPKRIESIGAIVLAIGPCDLTYSIEYSGYREATVTTKIHGAAR